MHGAILTHYLAKSSDAVALFVPPNSATLGLPTSDEHDIERVRGARLSTFERGSIYWTAAMGPVIVKQPILDGFLISGGVAHWGMPTGPARVAVKDDTTVTWQTFERGVLAHTDKVGWFDALRVRIARVDTGLIDDDGAFEPEDKRGEVFVKAWVSVNGVEVLHRESPAGNYPSFAVLDDWKTAGIPLREDTRIDVRIEAWDWDEASDDDHLATHSATFSFGDALFGYADTLGDYPKRKSTWNNSNEASATAVVFSYSIAPHVAATLGVSVRTTSIDSAIAGARRCPGTSTTRRSPTSWLQTATAQARQSASSSTPSTCRRPVAATATAFRRQRSTPSKGGTNWSSRSVMTRRLSLKPATTCGGSSTEVRAPSSRPTCGNGSRTARRRSTCTIHERCGRVSARLSPPRASRSC